MMKLLRRLTLVAALGAVCVPGAPALSAETAPKAEAPDATQPDIPEQKLDAAAAAMLQVADLKESYQQRLDAAPPADKERIATEANDALKKAVTDKGLSVEEYSAIVAMAQTDPTVRGKILNRIRSPQK
jgi:hypothetical protein